jgi:hypothetical protein
LCNKVNGATIIGVILISFGKHVGGIALGYLLGRPISLFTLLKLMGKELESLGRLYT